MWRTKNAFFHEMQFWLHCYTVVSYQALFRLSVYKIPAVYRSGAKNVCFCTIRDFGSPTMCGGTGSQTRPHWFPVFAVTYTCKWNQAFDIIKFFS